MEDVWRVHLKRVPAVEGALKEPSERCYLVISDDYTELTNADLGPIFETHKNIVGIEFPKTISKITTELLEGHETIEYVKLGVNVTEIEQRAFLNCQALTKVEIPMYSKLKAIKDHAFYGCEQLNIIRFPDGLEEIGNCAFKECRALESIRLVGKTTKRIGIGVPCGLFQMPPGAALSTSYMSNFVAQQSPAL